MLSACTSGIGVEGAARVFVKGGIPSPVLDSAAACEQALRATAHAVTDESFGERLVVASWNTAKSVGIGWQIGLRRLAEEADILLLQEAAIISATSELLPYPFVAVSEGYRAALGPTGLLSASHVNPVASCTFLDWEPLLRTPKASSITSYPIGKDEETLLVANVHAINFSFGMGAFTKQIERISRAMQSHAGPIIFAGDFNTWNQGRADVVARLIKDLDLQEVAFDDSARRSVFGYPLDRIFWRGMTLDTAKTEALASSDHAALIASWRFR